MNPIPASLNAKKPSNTRRAEHHAYMEQALRLAQEAHVHDTLPNPRVGAVVVKNGAVISTGYHKARGTLHAERDALKRLSASETQGATLYCTLEPCCAQWEGKRQPPCTDAILKSGITCVYIASEDPNPKVRGRGIALLQKHNVHVEILSQYTKAERIINETVYALYACAHFEHGRAEYTRPFVHAKTAQSLDARLGAQDGSSAWITNTNARKEVHRMRSETHMLCTGVGSILVDNPRYSVRHVRGSSPALAVFDSSLKTPPHARIFETTRRDPGIVVCTTEQGYENKRARRALENAGAHIACIGSTKNAQSRVPLAMALAHLVKLGVYSIMLEAGATLSNAFLNQALVDKLSCFIAPLFLGGGSSSLRYALGPSAQTPSMNQAVRLVEVSARVLEGATNENANCLVSGYMRNIFEIEHKNSLLDSPLEI